MNESRPILRRATAEDIEAFSSAHGKPSMIAWAADLDGRIVGLGGLMFTRGRWFGFCDLTEELRPYKMLIAKAGKMAMEEARRLGIRYVYAEMDVGEPRSWAWLTRLGFVRDPRSMSLYRWGG